MPADLDLPPEAVLCLKVVKQLGPVAHGVEVHDRVRSKLSEEALYGPADTFLNLRRLARRGLLEMVLEEPGTERERTCWKLTNSGMKLVGEKLEA